MPFSPAGASALSGFSIAPGVESAVLRWDATALPVEVWRNEVEDDFATATLITLAVDNSFTDSPLPPDVEVWHYARTVKSLTTGGSLPGPVSSGSSVPARAELGEGQVETANIAIGAVTDRSIYEDLAVVGVEYGTDATNTPKLSEPTITLPNITFEGNGSTMVITCIARQMLSPVIFRAVNTQVYAGVSAWVIDVTDELNPVNLDNATLYVLQWKCEVMPVATSPVTIGMNRDFMHKFILETEIGKTYAISFILFAGLDDDDNYVQWESDLRQVTWEVYKR